MRSWLARLEGGCPAAQVLGLVQITTPTRGRRTLDPTTAAAATTATFYAQTAGNQRKERHKRVVG
jgi:hypothetical protein